MVNRSAQQVHSTLNYSKDMKPRILLLISKIHHMEVVQSNRDTENLYFAFLMTIFFLW